jgi:hypothetical protein
MHGGGFGLVVVGADDGRWRNVLGLTVGLSGKLEFFGDVGAGRGTDGRRHDRRCSSAVGAGGGEGNERCGVGEGGLRGNGFWGEMKWVGLACRGS